MTGDIHTILVVCSANQCRSPLAAACLTRIFATRGLDIAVTSAGVNASTGSSATSGTVRTAKDLGLDLAEHRSQPTTRELLAGADLILGMERLHLREAVVLERQAFPRSFTLKELVRRGEELGPRRPGETQADWLAAAHRDRQPADLFGASRDDDIADPTTDMTVDHDTMAQEVAELVQRLVGLLWPVGVD